MRACTQLQRETSTILPLLNVTEQIDSVKHISRQGFNALM